MYFKTQNVNSQSNLKTTMLESSLCDYSYANLLVEGTINVFEQGAKEGAITADRNDKQIHSIFLNIGFWQSRFDGKWCIFSLCDFN